MDKLFKLLKQSAKERWMAQRWNNLWEYLSYSGRYKNESELVMISERYGFIRWLVETQKIDTFKLSEARFDTMKIYEWTNYKTVNDGNTDRLVMLLSIQERPVELLIDLLK